ncbi:MAG: trypsin-like peptidase domain-containing protein, partial [Clostridia bacterium]|nr:trypsin-like peptidase domain-containing protein [Clostridia bacterium]
QSNDPVTLPDSTTPPPLSTTAEEVFHTVSFYVNGSVYHTEEVKSGSYALPPDNPTQENKIFLGCYYDTDFQYPFAFATPVTGPVIAYAKFTIDAGALTNKITTDTIRAMVKIETVSYNTFWGFTTETAASQGSGVVFAEGARGSNTYYILTNCHVARKDDGFDKVRYTVYDYQGNAYEAVLFEDSAKPGPAIDPAYDLACLAVKAPNGTFPVIPLAEEDPALGADVVSLGYPQGQSNAITFGTVTRYGAITLSDADPLDSNVTFPVIWHTALITGGSSGGPLLSDTLTLVGLNYAGQKGEGFHNGYAIPISRIKEFLETYVYA